MTYTLLSFHSDVRLDLDTIKSTDASGHARLAALLRQLQADPQLAEKLLDHGLGARRIGQLSVSKWLAEWKSGRDLWRLKFWDLEELGLQYRVIYVIPLHTSHASLSCRA